MCINVLICGINKVCVKNSKFLVCFGKERIQVQVQLNGQITVGFKGTKYGF